MKSVENRYSAKRAIKSLTTMLLRLMCMVGVGVATTQGLTSCAEEENHNGVVPRKGEVTYDLTYSEELARTGDMGTFLPHSVSGIYDTANVKLISKAPLGLASISLTLGCEEDFIAIDLDQAKMLLRPQDLVSEEERNALTSKMKISVEPGITEISGFKSRHIVLTPDDTLDTDVVIDLFYAPFSGIHIEESTDYRAFIFHRDQSSKRHFPGLITAIKTRVEDKEMQIMLKSVKAMDSITAEDFKRPEGFVETSRDELIAMVDMLTR